MGNGDELTFDEAERMDEAANKYFKPETNISYVLTFSSWKLHKESIADYNDKSKFNVKPVLTLVVESIDNQYKNPNGDPLVKTWDIIGRRLRDTFEPFCTSGNITKKVFQFKKKGEGKDSTYTLQELKDKSPNQ